MKSNFKIVAMLALVPSFFGSHTAAAAQMALEHKYQEVFVSAGYSTALGAAVGAALLAFKDEPTDHLKYVAIGASIGFFAGTAFGTYLVVAPSFATHDDEIPTPVAAEATKDYQLIVRPTLNTDTWKVRGLETGMVLARF